ncbi:MocR-like pyridoxine biosynthesis transcription factor PdxR [Ferrimonas marina]|uniref:GntR family transcriptional regulator / MocR family aminotransferase n=1 Tax=Ferrimonas marina TaxID=299255 RepID=A0A1M5X7E6_9GAMM|nr:PLP-dependent aminotransferase family protein [Ferrimonas marina]SHH95552.1 GntR family transcriptional regulator / MocR family aminotransferase [Ferrimonas marina]
MQNHLFQLDNEGGLSLQQQLKQKLINAIADGFYPAGTRMPSSRKLADQLGVARNTVVHTFAALVDEGYLESRERSGYYVCEAPQPVRLASQAQAQAPQRDWQPYLKRRLPATPARSYPDNWHKYPYPFIDGQFDPSLFPTQPWRECSRLSLSVDAIHEWASDGANRDDPLLVEEIRTKVLPRRGIQAEPEEILITLGSQQALYLLMQLFADESSLIAMEEPGFPGMRQLVQLQGSRLALVDVDPKGIEVDSLPAGVDLLYVTPSHQVPTAVTLSMGRREALLARAEAEDFLIFEDDYESESNFVGQPHPALKSLDKHDRVLYFSSFSKVLAPGLRLGYLVGPAPLIAQARALRSQILRHPPSNNQRTMGLFLSLGHYDTMMRKINQQLAERWQELREALNHYLPTAIVTSRTVGGSSCWIQGPSELGSQELANEAAKRGILLEPVQRFFGDPRTPQNALRLGVSSIPTEQIRPGIAALAELYWSLSEAPRPQWQEAQGERLDAASLPKQLGNCEFIGRTVFGDPYRIRLYPDGTMEGWEGRRDERSDQGQWWIEGDRWFRQWHNWSYGEVAGYQIVLEHNRILWFRDGTLVDSAFFSRLS